MYIFDLDGTLTESRSPADAEMVDLFKTLLERHKVGIVSGAGLAQIQKQILSLLPEGTNLANLTVCPTSGASMYIFNGSHAQKVYDEAFSEEELQQVSIAIAQVLQEIEFDLSAPSYGERLVQHTGQISFALLGENAPNEEKILADPDQKIRQSIVAQLTPLLPNYSIRVAGGHTIDITKPGIDKAYAIDQIRELHQLPIESMIYIGDELKENGNDAPVLQTSISTHPVQNPEETKAFIKEII